MTYKSGRPFSTRKSLKWPQAHSSQQLTLGDMSILGAGIQSLTIANEMYYSVFYVRERIINFYVMVEIHSQAIFMFWVLGGLRAPERIL